MCLILEEGLFFSSSAFPLWDRNTGRLLWPGNYSLFSQKDKYYLYFLFFPIYCIVLGSSGKSGRQTAETLPSPMTWWMTSHIPGPDKKRGHRGSCCCFQMLKRPITYSWLSFRAWEELPRAGSAQADPALPWSIPLQQHGQPTQESRLPVSLLTHLWIFYQTCWMLWPQSTCQPQREEHSQISLSLLWPASVVRSLFSLFLPSSPLRCAQHVDRPSTFTVSPYVPREHPTYTTHGQPTRKPLQTQAGAGQEPPVDAKWQDEEGKRVLAPRCTPVHERSLLDRCPCTNRGFAPLPTFDHLTALSKMTLGGMERGPLRCVFFTCWTATWRPGAGGGQRMGC